MLRTIMLAQLLAQLLASPASAADPAAKPHPRWGDANAANLAAMARAADLAGPAASSPAHGPQEAAAVQRLFNGTVHDLRREGAQQADMASSAAANPGPPQ